MNSARLFPLHNQVPLPFYSNVTSSQLVCSIRSLRLASHTHNSTPTFHQSVFLSFSNLNIFILKERPSVFFYSCPSSSPIKDRMLYSSGSSSVFQRTKSILSTSHSSILYPRKIETSDPKELTERFLVDELGFAGPNAGGDGGKVPFA